MIRGAVAGSVHVPFVSVDPGKAAGYACWERDGTMLACGLTDGDAPVFPFANVPLLVIERPHEGEGKATKRDLITLARRMGSAIAVSRATRTIEVFPVQWKGTVPKVFVAPTSEKFYPAEDMIKSWMTAADKATFEVGCKGVAKGKRNNILDAVGIGIWYCRKVGMR